MGAVPVGANSRYYDTYTSAQTSARVGEALGSATTSNPGGAEWHSASSTNWVNRNIFQNQRGRFQGILRVFLYVKET